MPDFADLTPIEQRGVGVRLHLLTSLYVFVAAWRLRRWGARLHVRAEQTQGAPPAPLRIVLVVTLPALMLSIPALVLVGQFLNHDWLVWLNHPLVGLPWTPAPG